MRAAAAFMAAAMLVATPVFAADGLYINAEFENSYIDYGTNKFTVFGENNTDETQTFRIVNAASENGRLITTTDGGMVTVAPGSSFNVNSSIDIPSEADLGNTKVDVYLWDKATGTSPISQQISQNGVKFSYELSEDAITSAAVYDGAGTLVQTLWSAEQRYKGTNYGVWNGKDDAGNPMPEGKYEVKILSHNVKYIRDAVVGNNTEIDKAMTTMTGYNTISDMCLVGSRMYYAEQYEEGLPSCRYFDISNPHRVAGYLEKNNTRINIRNATDGERVYWMTVQETPKSVTNSNGETVVNKTRECFIYAHDVNAEPSTYLAQTVEFAAGVKKMDIWNVREQFCAIGVEQYQSLGSVYNTGYYGHGDLAVQKNGNFLAATYGDRDFIRIINKVTGATVKDNAVTDPIALAFDENDKLWASYKEGGNCVIKRFVINSDGSLTLDKTAEISGYTEEVLALTVSPDGSGLTVAYGGDLNKVVSYNISDWSVAWTFGSGESYKTDPTVYDDKLLFKQEGSLATESADGCDLYSHTYITYEDNNTVWVGDTGNMRAHKLKISGASVSINDSIYYPKQSYAMAADANDATRVFLGLYEYDIDYTKEGSDSWRLYKNWVYEAQKLNSDTYDYVSALTTLSNGRTYFMAQDASDGKDKIYELMDTVMRPTGIDVSNWFVTLDGSFALQNLRYEKSDGILGRALYRRDLTGFDQSNNPVWGEEYRVAFVPSSVSATLSNRSAVTDSGLIISLGISKYSLRTDADMLDMRLKAIAADPSEANADYAWQTAPSTMRNYNGDFARNGAFEIGGGTWNTVHHSPSVFGDNIIFAYTGEGYKANQAEIFYHYTADGLLVGVYGYVPYDQAEYDDYGMTVINGNGFNWNLVYPEGGDGDTAYIYQGGEARLSGLVRFKVTGLNSIKTQSIGISLGSKLRSGLTAELYEGSEYVNTSVIKTKAVDTADIISGGESLSEYGIRYTGYITKPADSEENTKIWVYTDGDAELKIGNVIRARGTGMIGALVNMQSGKSYSIELDVKNSGNTLRNIKLCYEAGGKVKEFPMANLYTVAPQNEAIHKTVNLLEGLSVDSELTENGSGWNFGDLMESSPASVVKTNYAKYDIKDQSDLYINMNLLRGESAEVRRDLGTPMDNLNEWEIDADIMLLGDPNGWYTGTVSGEQARYIDILDENDKIIARVYAKKDYGVYGNDTLIYQTAVPSGYTRIAMTYTHDLATLNPLKISCVGGYVNFEYKTGCISTGIYDSTANWQKPAAIRITASKQSYTNPYKVPFTTVLGKLTYTQSAAEDTYIVTFYDEDKTTVLKRESVPAGRSATPPNVERAGYILSWSTDFSSVTSNMNIYAIYTKDETSYTVTFYDEDKTYLGTAQAVYGTAPTAPNPSKENYKFIGWYKEDGTAVDLAKITGDTIVYAKYQPTGTFTEDFEGAISIDYTQKTVSGSELSFTASDNMYTVNTNNGENVMSVASVSGKDETATKALYVNPYKSAVGESLNISFTPIRSGKARVSFDYMVSEYAFSYGFNYFGALCESATGYMASCMTQIRSFGNQNPFPTWDASGSIRRVDKVLDADGKYTSYDVVSTGNSWHSMSYEIDMDARKYTLTVDGSTVGTFDFYDEEIVYVDSVYFRGLIYSSTQNIGKYYIDNIEVEYLN